MPVSATTGEQVDVLIDVLVEQLSPGPAFYPDGELTDETTAKFIGEQLVALRALAERVAPR